jgi:hypothetical protein
MKTYELEDYETLVTKSYLEMRLAELEAKSWQRRLQYLNYVQWAILIILIAVVISHFVK